VFHSLIVFGVRLHSPQHELLESSADDDDNNYNRCPGPLTGMQRRECADKWDSVRLWMEEKARVWGMSVSSITHALGLHNTATRAKSEWNMHQARFYAEEKRGPDGMFFYICISYHTSNNPHRDPG
jgi:hypothetical protein